MFANIGHTVYINKIQLGRKLPTAAVIGKKINLIETAMI
ncbi:hypothetical protein RG47T_2589 [Mucilaginibacter polytrichastri]|uniref:Uncharacterized protein n=1 Tax=Mucilaginibacter polytrichastri TaxID=1302689 RepID=A0A1Q5ZZD9_9SPHI|nr:hypothetical protein RG47T_2589 [Mucilaginibacter polytrichastri]